MEKPEKPKLGIEDKRRGKTPGHTAEEKCRAVLSVWTERRSPGEVCREMGVGWTLLNQWQERAMEGMLLALEPRVLMTEKKVALNWRLAVLLERKSKAAGMKKTERRLSRLQGDRVKQPVELREDPSEKKV
jgi:transposase-like protein